LEVEVEEHRVWGLRFGVRFGAQGSGFSVYMFPSGRDVSAAATRALIRQSNLESAHTRQSNPDSGMALSYFQFESS